MNTISRRSFLWHTAAGLMVGGLAGTVRAAAPLAGRRPNVIVILTDDQGYGDVARHGNPVIRTPHLDRMHDESLRFEDFHVSPTCAPTRASLMTGRHEFKSGITHTILERERLSLKAVTIAQVLKSAGYATGIFGKWHLGDEADRRPDKRGFDETFIHGAGGIGQTYPGSCGDAPGNTYFDPAILHNGTFEKTKGYCTDIFFGQAVKWIESRKGAGPFFAYITPNAPHGPLQCPEEYAAPYRGKVDEHTAKFFGMVTNIDDNVGRLLAKLDEWGIAKDTLVVFMNDNGGTGGLKVWNAGMRTGKGTCLNGGTRAMCFCRWPGTLAPAASAALTAHLDWFPTLVELCGAKAREGVKLDGYSLLPLFADPKAAWPDRFLVTHVGRWPKGKAVQSKYDRCSIRRGPWLLASNAKDGRKNWALYNLRDDPGEKNDVASAQPAVVKELEKLYDGWWDEVLPCLENEDAVGPAVNPFKELYLKQESQLRR